MARITLPPGEYRLSQTLELGELSLREGREFVVAGTLGAAEHKVLNLLNSDVLQQDALAPATPERD